MVDAIVTLILRWFHGVSTGTEQSDSDEAMLTVLDSAALDLAFVDSTRSLKSGI